MPSIPTLGTIMVTITAARVCFAMFGAFTSCTSNACADPLIVADTISSGADTEAFDVTATIAHVRGNEVGDGMRWKVA